jgi:hypothetical protein
MSQKELEKQKMKELFGGTVYKKPEVEEVTEQNFEQTSKDNAVIACRSLLGC